MAPPLGVPEMVAALRAGDSNAAVLSRCAETLAGLGSRERSDLVEAGGCEALVTAMASNLTNTHLQLGFITALKHLHPGQDAFAARLIAAGLCEALVASLRMYPTRAGVQQERASLAMLLLAHPDAVARLAAAGLAGVLVASLQAHVRNASACAVMLTSIACFAFASHVAGVKTSALGGGKAALAALSAHSSNLGVQEEGVGAISRLAQAGEASRARLVADGALAVVPSSCRHPIRCTVQLRTASKARNLPAACTMCGPVRWVAW
jgi:hypothetical protein